MAAWADPCLRRCAPRWASWGPAERRAARRPVAGRAAGGAAAGRPEARGAVAGLGSARAWVRRRVGSAGSAAAGFGLGGLFRGLASAGLACLGRSADGWAALAARPGGRRAAFRVRAGAAFRSAFRRSGGRFRGWVSFRWAFRIVPAAGCCLPWVKCFRYCLPNFPHSPATEGRERQRLHAFLADGAKSALLLSLIQLVCLGSYYQVRPAVMLEPPLEIEIFLHPSAAGIQNQAGKHQSLSIVQILLDQNLPLAGEPLGDPGISIAR